MSTDLKTFFPLSNSSSKSELPARVKAEILFLGAECKIADWLMLKKMLLRCLPIELRKYFSIRHPVSKIPRLNDFEKRLIHIYECETGIQLSLPKDISNE